MPRRSERANSIARNETCARKQREMSLVAVSKTRRIMRRLACAQRGISLAFAIATARFLSNAMMAPRRRRPSRRRSCFLFLP